MPKKLAQIGDYYGVMGSTCLLGATVLSSINDDNFENQFKMSAGALSTDIFLTYLIKYGVGRERPDKSNFRSFPSGHSSVSFLNATLISGLTQNNYIAVPVFSFATITALSRIQDKKHYLSDTIAGAFLGIAVGNAFLNGYDIYTDEDEESSKSQLTLIFPPIKIIF